MSSKSGGVIGNIRADGDQGRTLMVDTKRLSRYLKVITNIANRKDGKTSYIPIDYRNCRASDFEDQGIESDPLKLKRLCPHIEKMSETYNVKNGYSATERNSFSVQIEKC
jgi:hypothetical protein